MSAISGFPCLINNCVFVAPAHVLSQRQQYVWWALASSLTTKEIAAQLHLSPKTIEYHRAALFRVLNLRDLPALTRAAIRVGLLPP